MVLGVGGARATVVPMFSISRFHLIFIVSGHPYQYYCLPLQHTHLLPSAQVQQRSVHRRAAAHHPCRWPGPELDRRRHGGVRGARLEPHEGPAGHGPCPQDRAGTAVRQGQTWGASWFFQLFMNVYNTRV